MIRLGEALAILEQWVEQRPPQAPPHAHDREMTAGAILIVNDQVPGRYEGTVRIDVGPIGDRVEVAIDALADDGNQVGLAVRLRKEDAKRCRDDLVRQQAFKELFD